MLCFCRLIACKHSPWPFHVERSHLIIFFLCAWLFQEHAHYKIMSFRCKMVHSFFVSQTKNLQRLNSTGHEKYFHEKWIFNYHRSFKYLQNISIWKIRITNALTKMKPTICVVRSDCVTENCRTSMHSCVYYLCEKTHCQNKLPSLPYAAFVILLIHVFNSLSFVLIQE